MALPDDLKLSRHVTAFMGGDFPEEALAVSSPEVMAKIEPIFAGYSFSPSTVFVDLRAKIENLFHSKDPLDIIEKGNLQQIDEYRPEADMTIWLYLQKKFTPETFWAIWEYQFAGSHHFKSGEDSKLSEIYLEVVSILEN